MKLHVIVLTCLMHAMISHAQDSTGYTLQQCIDIAIKHNLDLQVAACQLDIAGVNLQQSRAAALPYASAYANQGINKGKSINPYTNTFINQEIITGQYGVNAGLTLFNGFNLLNTMRQNYFNYEATKMDREQLKLDMTINAMLAYLQVLSCQEQLSQAASQVEVSNAQVQRLMILEKNDAISPSVLYDTKGQLANDKLTYLSMKSSLATAKITLGQLIGIHFPSNATFEKTGITVSPIAYGNSAETIISEASAALPMVKAAELRRLSAVKNIHASRALLFPSLSLVGNIGTNYSDAALAQKLTGATNQSTDQYVMIGSSQVPVFAPQYEYSSSRISFNNQFTNNLNSYIGLSLQIPLFNGLKTRSQLSIAKINREQAEVKQTATNVRLKNNIAQAYNDMSVSYERYLLLQQQVSDYSESLKIGTVKFEKGAITSVDYMIAKNNSDKSKMNLIASKYEYILKCKVLDYFMEKTVL